MKSEKPLAYQDVLDRLIACGAIKAWSLIVTILGDMNATQGARIPGPLLSRLTEPMGVKPEALRVAVHRLRRDGWITSEREGRTSLYELSAHGRELTKSVSARVYEPVAAAPKAWKIVIAPNAEVLQNVDHPDFMPISARAGLMADDEAELTEGLLAWVAQPGDIPDWAKHALVSDELTQAYAKLSPALDAALKLELPDDLIARAVLRFAALHQWRRLILRHSAAVETLMGPEWAGAQCRAHVTQFFSAIKRPDIDALRAETET